MNLTTTQLAQTLGVTTRNIDHWLRRGYITCHQPAHGSGTARRFNQKDLANARAFIAQRKRCPVCKEHFGREGHK